MCDYSYVKLSLQSLLYFILFHYLGSELQKVYHAYAYFKFS